MVKKAKIKKNIKKKITIFSGAGISKESGINTFRDKGGTWENVNIDDVATPNGWKKDKEKVLNFYNNMRIKLKNIEPNIAHKLIADLEKDYNVSVITQNVDNLHERAHSTNILHLHGELTKVRGTYYNNNPFKYDRIYDIGYEEINIGDKCEITNSQLRPHVVWFNEMPFNVEESYKELLESDIIIIVGTSFNISYTIELIGVAIKDNNCKVYYVDPKPSKCLDEYRNDIIYVEKNATTGIKEIVNKIRNE